MPRSAATVHQGLPLLSGFGSCTGFSEARNGDISSEKTTVTLSGFTFGLAALAISPLSSDVLMLAGSAF